MRRRAPLLIIGATDARSVATLEDAAVDLRFGFARVRKWAWWLGVGIRIDSDKC